MNAPPGYDFLRHISDGGFGTVIEVSENSTGEHFAVKMMRSMSEKDKERIGREVHRLRVFIHPGIVRLKELVPMENMEAIVMELGGQSLAQLVKSHSERGVLIDRHIVYQVMVDISSALCFMHNHGTEPTAHGDVKLENILLFGDGDLGGAESEDVSSTRGVMSMQYVSPERMDDENGRARASADVWALGIVLHWLLFGKGLFSGQTMIKLAREIGSFKPSQIEMSCGEEERELLMRMLDPDEGSRLTSKQLVESSILRCLINSKEEGWKLYEMKSREMEKAEKERNELQNELNLERAARLKEKEESENALKRKMEEMATLMHHEQPKVNDGKHEGSEGTEQQLEGQLERTDERVVSIRTGADAIEWFESERWWLIDSIFTCHKPSYTTLLTFSFEKVVARFTFIIRQITDNNSLGIIATKQTDAVKRGLDFSGLFGGAGWNVRQNHTKAVQNWKTAASGSVCAAGKAGQRVVLEADGRDGRRTLRLSQDGQTQPTFFSHIPVPFRLAILLRGRDDSVQIESLEELTEPTLTGGTREIKMEG